MARVAFIAHCLLNQNAKVEGGARCPGVYSPLVAALRARGWSIVQMPCPELAFTGLNRFWAVKEQYDTAAYRRHADQDCAPDDDPLRRGVRTRHNFDGTTTIEITLDPVEAADFLAVLDAFMADAAGERIDTDGREPEPGSAGPSACADHDSAIAVVGAAKDPAGSSARADDRRLWGPRRAHAIVDMCRTALNVTGDLATFSVP